MNKSTIHHLMNPSIHSHPRAYLNIEKTSDFIEERRRSESLDPALGLIRLAALGGDHWQ